MHDQEVEEVKGQYVGCFEHDVGICGDRERPNRLLLVSIIFSMF